VAGWASFAAQAARKIIGRRYTIFIAAGISREGTVREKVNL
jgi:hypothetical protein